MITNKNMQIENRRKTKTKTIVEIIITTIGTAITVKKKKTPTKKYSEIVEWSGRNFLCSAISFNECDINTTPSHF